MATVVLQYAGAAIGTLIGGPVGGIIGRAAGAIAGNIIDQQVLGPGTRKTEGPRLSDLRVMASEEGAAVPRVYGRMRLAGQVIWATDLEEVSDTKTQSASGKGGPKSKTTTYSYFANFAVGLCEGEINRLGRVWADGREIDLERFTTRLYTGSETQEADSLITAKEGAGNAPAYRGLAYIVFERLPLEDFGNRIPQLSFEVFAGASAAADAVRAITIIPGSTEFGYDTIPVTRQAGPGITASENAHVSAERTDWSVSLDDLQGTCRNLGWASLVTAWFASDLRCATCTLMPGVDAAAKTTQPESWAVAGLTRAAAHQMSLADGKPAFGGTPSDASVIRAIADLRARGLKVMLYPFILHDIPTGNGLPDPHGGSEQAAYPWRGRMTASLAPGQAGSPDKTSAVTAEVNAFFGTAAPAHFSVSAGQVVYSGPPEWSYRRMILHHAALAQAAGGVDGFIIGSELRGLTTLRSATGLYPAVGALVTLAADVKAMLPAAELTYAADWSEYAGHHPDDGSGDHHFHLDPLWASTAIAAVGIDNYMPLSDWRDGNAHLDAASHASIHDTAYLRANIAGGEGFDWYYASPADRLAQIRSPIADGAHGKPWVFRYKDLVGWWSNTHINRIGGTETGPPTAWLPQGKPIWFTEAGCPAVDKGTNAPNTFIDAKSAESALPHFSAGFRDDLIQHRYIQAVQGYWQEAGGHNPVSSVYGTPMVDAGRIFFWAWDARPFPAFPQRTDVWADGANHARGHWLNGRLAAADLSAIAADLCERFGIAGADVSDLAALVDGLVLDRPMSARDALENILAAFAFDMVESEGTVKFRTRKVFPALALSAESLVEDKPDEPLFALRRHQETDLPRALRLVYAESANDYRQAAVERRGEGGSSQRDVTLSLPVAVSQAVARTRAEIAFAEAWAGRDAITLSLPPSLLRLEPGDAMALDGVIYRLTQMTDGAARRVEALGHEPSLYDPPPAIERGGRYALAAVFGQPDAVMMDLPLADGASPGAPWIAAAATPWPGQLALLRQSGSASFVLNRTVDFAATLGETLTAFPAAPPDVLDLSSRLDVRMDHGALSSVSDEELLNGANAAAVGDAATGFEIIQFARADLVAPGTWRLSRFLRGQAGSEPEMLASRPTGSRFILLNAAVVQAVVAGAELGLASIWRIGPARQDHGAPSYLAMSHQPALRAFRPLAPVHLAARAGAGGITVTWVRRTRLGGDAWELEDVPLGEASESYRVDVMNGAAVIRSTTVPSPAWLYDSAAITADFGSLPPTLTVRVAQISATAGTGPFRERTLHV